MHYHVCDSYHAKFDDDYQQVASERPIHRQTHTHILLPCLYNLYYKLYYLISFEVFQENPPKNRKFHYHRITQELRKHNHNKL